MIMIISGTDASEILRCDVTLETISALCCHRPNFLHELSNPRNLEIP